MKITEPSTEARQPVLRQIVNLWTLVWHPSKKKEWSLERKIAAVKEAGFDGFMDRLTAQHQKHAERFGLISLGFFDSSNTREFRSLLRKQRDAGAKRINVQLGNHDTNTPTAVGLSAQLDKDSEVVGVETSIEVHRDTCTETPEKTYALADEFKKRTGKPIRFTWDFSHLAVVKHLLPPFWEKLGRRVDLIRHANQFHFRPFNGHHCQVPVTNGQGQLTPEFLDYRPFMEQVIATWLQSAPPGRELFAVPELGPLWLGYNLHSLPSSWEDAQVLRLEIQKAWRRALKTPK